MYNPGLESSVIATANLVISSSVVSRLTQYSCITHSIASHQFDVQPESVVQAEGLEAVFECRYPGALVLDHVWRINGSGSDQWTSDVMQYKPSEAILTPTLVIPATPQYNNTVVQCIAIVDEGGGSFTGVLSKNATLKVQGIE